MKSITYAKAVCEAMDEEMARDDKVLLFGEDVAWKGGTYNASVGLLDKYGPMRVFDTPISESGFTGMGVGMAITGLRPIVEFMFGDFMLVAADQLFNQAAKLRYMTGGQVKVPMAKGLLKASIRDDDPVMFLESKMLYNQTFEVDDEVEPIPLGKAKVVMEGNDVTIVATSVMVLKAKEAAEKLKAEGISVELIDLRTIVPLDMETVLKSVRKTGRLLICDEGYEMCNIATEISFRVMEDAFYDMDAPVERLCTPNTSIPFTPALEYPLLPTNPDKVYAKVKHIMGK